jgi:hypothetical protein
MDLPAGGLPKSFNWPNELLLPASATPITYMHFPNRSSYYGNFSLPGSPSINLSDISKALETDGWISVTGEAYNSLAGKGEIFIRENPPGIMMLNCSDGKNGISNAAIYMRPLKSAK